LEKKELRMLKSNKKTSRHLIASDAGVECGLISQELKEEGTISLYIITLKYY
jgi:hypothetical protein